MGDVTILLPFTLNKFSGEQLMTLNSLVLIQKDSGLKFFFIN